MSVLGKTEDTSACSVSKTVTGSRKRLVVRLGTEAYQTVRETLRFLISSGSHQETTSHFTVFLFRKRFCESKNQQFRKSR